MVTLLFKVVGNFPRHQPQNLMLQGAAVYHTTTQTFLASTVYDIHPQYMLTHPNTQHALQQDKLAPPVKTLPVRGKIGWIILLEKWTSM